MSTPNPELATALNEAAFKFDLKQNLENQIERFSDLVKQDTFVFRPREYSRNTYTAAMLLAGDSDLREKARAKGIDVHAFDNIVGQVQQLILEETNKPVPGIKVATVLRKLTGI